MSEQSQGSELHSRDELARGTLITIGDISFEGENRRSSFLQTASERTSRCAEGVDLMNKWGKPEKRGEGGIHARRKLGGRKKNGIEAETRTLSADSCRHYIRKPGTVRAPKKRDSKENSKKKRVPSARKEKGLAHDQTTLGPSRQGKKEITNIINRGGVWVYS